MADAMCKTWFALALAVAVATAITIDDADMTGFAAVILVDTARHVEADAAAVASAICWICCCINSDVKTKVSNRID